MEYIKSIYGFNIRTTVPFNLRYNASYISELGKHCDTHLKTDDGTIFEVHSKLLSRQSQYFDVLFSIKEEIGQSTVLRGIESDVFENILIYLYTGSILLSSENMMQILVAADFLMMESLFHETKIFVLKNIAIDNCVTLYKTAYRIKSLDMEYKCRRFFQLCFEKAVKHSWEEALDLPFKSLEHFLGSTSVNVSGERFVWEFIEKWVLRDPSNRTQAVPELLRHLSMDGIDAILGLKIISSPIFLKNVKFSELLFDYHRNLGLTLTSMLTMSKEEILLTFRNKVPFNTEARLPRRVHFITQKFPQRDVCELFLTYDDHLDLWRKVGQLFFRPLKLLKVDHHVYVFEGHSLFRGISGGSTYDLLKNVVEPLAPLQRGIFDVCFAVEVAGHVYALKNDAWGEEVGFYRHARENNRWRKISHMHHHRKMVVKEAVGLNGLLYAIGQNTDDNSMVFQVYDPNTKSWKMASPPHVERRRMAAVGFQEKIFLIGGEFDDFEFHISRNVEVYDCVKDEWDVFPELLFNYECVRGSVWNDRLFVFSNEWPVPVTCWDGSGEWKIVESRLLRTHWFCSIEGEGVVREVMKENKEVDVGDWDESGLENNEMFLGSTV